MVIGWRSLRAVLSAMLLLGIALPALAEVRVSIDRNPVHVNESFQLVFSLDYNPDHDPDFSTLQQHFTILANNRSSSISIINGEYQRSIKWTLRLMPKQVGEFMIPAIRFDRERSKPFEITVKPSAVTSLPENELLLEMLADRDQAYVQSQVVLTLRLLSASNIAAYQFGEVKIDSLDVVIEPLGDVRQYQTRIGDQQFLVLERKYALFPQQSGRLEVEPALAEVRLPSRSGFDPFQTSGEIRRLRSQALALEVEPIPPDFRAPYWLPATNVELREEWRGDLDALVAGEPITRQLTLVADGLTAAQLPEIELPPIDGIKQYPDQPSLDNRRSSKGMRATRAQNLALIPGAAGRYLVPEIELPWWNLETGKMEIASLPARELIVSAPPSMPEAPASVEPAPLASAPAQPAPVIESNPFWLWLSLLLACGWALSAAYWWLRSRPRSQSDGLAESPSLREARRRLQQACAADDAVAARGALLDWGQALLAPAEVANLHRLCAICGAELTHQVEAINHSLYARERNSWRGDELAELCRRLEQDRARPDSAKPGLVPLNPAA